MPKFIYAWAIVLLTIIAPQLLQAQCDTSPSNVTTTNGLGYLEIDSNDVQTVNLMTSSTASANFVYVLTDASFNIIRFVNGNTEDLSDLDAGKYFIWGFSYTGSINLVPGQLVFTGSFSTGCFQISNTAVVIQKLTDGGGSPEPIWVGRFFVSSNTQANIAVYNIFDNGTIGKTTFPSGGTDADGIYYDMDADALYQLNRTNNVVNAYNMVVSQLDISMNPTISATSTSNFTNGREITLIGDRLVVAQDADASNGNQNALLIYQVSPTSISLLRKINVDINLWGIQAVGGTLYAVVDNSNKLAIYENFFGNADGTTATPDWVIEVEGLVRTHGLFYDETTDQMLLTDVGDAANATDGAIVVVNDFTNAAVADGFVSMSEQIRLAGANTLLGNPVDIALDPLDNAIYVAERANGGGRVLGFAMPTASGNIAPVYNDMFAGASAIYFQAEGQTIDPVGQFFVSSNTQPTVGVFNLWENNAVSTNSFPSMANDADGIYFDADFDMLYQLNRSMNVVNSYSNVNFQLGMGMTPLAGPSSTSDFTNGREIAVSKGRLVATQDADPVNANMNRFVIYDISGGGIDLVKSYDTNINLWGIQAQGETLYAVVDNSNRVSVFNDFFNQPAGMVSPSYEVAVDGLVRTHGINYIPNEDLMILTDVGAATSPDDGAIIVVENWGDAAADGSISLDEQIKIAGPLSKLGNPVDVAFDRLRNVIYVAERANGGGRVLGFNYPTASGDAAPIYDASFGGASAIYLKASDDPISVLSNLVLSSNTLPVIGVYSIQSDDSVVSSSFTSVANDADGIFYDVPNDVIYQLNRTANVINAYGDVSANLLNGTDPMVSATSTADFTNGREIAVSMGRLVAIQDADASNGNQNAFVVYDATPSGISLSKTYTTSLNLWGLQAVGETVYAVEDNSNRVLHFNNFFSQPAGMIAPSLVVSVENLVRTHGLFYAAASDIMLLTDVGDATSPNDGAIVIVQNYTAASADGMISASEQVRIAGAATFLGNPVDVTFDPDRRIIYVAERANGGGRLLGFHLTATGDAVPMVNELFPGASSIHFSQADGSMLLPDDTASNRFLAPSVPQENLEVATPELSAFPNPASNKLNLLWEQPSTEEEVEVQIGVFNNQGKLMLVQNTSAISGENRLEIEVSGFVPGIYFVRMQSMGVVRMTKFVKE